MAYSEQTWNPGQAGGTPLSVTRLQHMEDGIAAAAVTADIGTPGTATGDALQAAYGLSVVATVSASATLAVGKFTPVDATAAARTMTLPTGAADAVTIGVEKVDASANTVSVTGNIRGVPATTITLPWQHETLLLRADSTGSWWPVAGHKTKATLDAAYVTRGSQEFNVKDYGAKGDGTTNDSAAFTAAITAANAVRGRVVVPWSATPYIVDSLTLSSRCVTLEGLGGGATRFGPSSVSTASVTLKQPSGSANALLTLNANGINLRNLMLDGNSRSGTGTLLAIPNGFEAQLDNIYVVNGGRIGIDCQSADNANWNRIFVYNCGANDGAGNSTYPAFRMQPIASDGSQTINNLNIQLLDIEFSQGVSLEIGNSTTTGYNYPEFVYIYNAHIESPTTYGGGIANPWPLVKVVNGRNIVFDNPFLYGGAGPLLTHEFSDSLATYGGLLLQGGQLLGQGVASTVQPATLIHLITGDQFQMVGTRLDQWGTQAVLADSGYGSQVFLDPLVAAGTGTVFVDNRTNKSTRIHYGNLTVTQDVTVTRHLLRPTPTGRTITSSAGVGTVGNSSSCDDHAGTVNFGTTASPPAAGAQLFSMAFSTAFPVAPQVTVQARDATTQALGLWAKCSTSTLFVGCTNAPAASQGSSVYNLDFRVGSR